MTHRSPLASTARGAFIGLVAALVIGGLAVFGLGLRALTRDPDCQGLSPAECAAEEDLTSFVGRRQVWAGGALALMGFAVFMLGRARQRPPMPTQPE